MALDHSSGVRARMRVRLLTGPARDAAVLRLSAAARRNLLLLDLLDQVGREPSASELPAQVLGAFDDGVLCGTAALRPSLVLEAGMDERVLDSLLPYFEAVETGLIKSERGVVDLLWRRLERQGKRALIDRIEHDEETPSLSSRDAVCILTHDPKFDVPAAVAAFATDAGYIGAMGSRRTT